MPNINNEDKTTQHHSFQYWYLKPIIIRPQQQAIGKEVTGNNERRNRKDRLHVCHLKPTPDKTSVVSVEDRTLGRNGIASAVSVESFRKY